MTTGAEQIADQARDRDDTANRLLKSSAERNYDPLVDIDWDAPPVEGKWYFPAELCSLYGTPLWESMTDEQRKKLAQHEIAWTCARGVIAEVGLMNTLLRIAAETGPVSPHSQYALTEVAEECRHSIMFGKAIEANLGDEVRRLPRLPKWVFRIGALVQAVMPINAATWAGILMVEDVLDKMQRETTKDDTVQPMIRMMNRIHILEEARHMTYAREELRRTVATSSKASLAANRFIIALAAYADPRLSLHPKVYRNVGLDPREARRQALANPHRHQVLQRHAKRYVDTLDQAGLLKGKFTMAVWRRSNLLEPGR